ncbi:unnamed protein product [Polarella glacialis]|uniref:AAA+ ATPase domain-containing protein n=1 Tax=Polarella glacialis TaxID=89957 RepID=A0A813FTV1_POLGL|nr:unnamed protein product [Polarella glacialis]
MLSTLRVVGSNGRAAAATGLALRRQSLSEVTLPFRRPQEFRVPSGAGRPRFCSGGDKKPAKGFEKFYRASENAKEGGKKAETEGQKVDAKDQKGPKETPEKDSGKDAKKPADKSDKKSSSGGSGSSQQPTQSQRQTMGLFAGLGAFMVYMYLNREIEEEDEITIQEMLREYLMKGYVEKIQIVNKSSCRVHLRPDAPNNKSLTIQLGTPEAFEAKIEAVQLELGIGVMDQVPIQYVSETDFFSELLPYLPSLLILIPLAFAARSMSGGMGGPGGGGGGQGGRNMFNIGKAFPNGQKEVKSKTKFADVAGLDQAKAEVVEFVDFLKNPAKYEHLGARVPKGGLLVGPPGTGKTLLAKAVAGEADVPFYSMSGSDFVEMYVGVGPSRVRDLFRQARETAPSIIFIDEIDAVGRKRSSGGGNGGGNDERENTLNQMLVEMDGFHSGTGVIVLAGTNRADVLDPALLRPGRFDRQIAIDKPDLNEREAIFMVHLRPVSLDPKLDGKEVARRMAALTPGFAGADIANICNEAAIFAARRRADAISIDDFERATERVLGGLPKTNNLMSPAERRTVALHESGHAVAGWFLENADPLLKVSIVPRSNGALGFAQYLPAEMSLYSKEAILDKIAVALGGRAAEELFVGRISTGASDDLDKVTKMAHSMVAVYGMNAELGLLSYGQSNSSQEFYKPYSEATAQLIDRETRAIVDGQYTRIKELLLEKKDLMNALADRLAEKETLVYHDLVAVMGERPFGLKDGFREFVMAGAENFATQEAAAKEAAAKKMTDDAAAAAAAAAAKTEEEATTPQAAAA